MRIVTVLFGVLIILCLGLVLLIFSFQSALGHDYLPLAGQLNTDIWRYLLADNIQILINHTQLDVNEERHLLDVKRLMWRLFTVTMLAVLIFLVGTYLIRTQWRKTCRGISLFGFLAVILGLLFAFLSGFRSGFIRFHELLFAADTWWFEPKSGLIQAFPLSYFQQFALFYVLLVGTVFALLYLISCIPRKGSISSSADTRS